MMQGLGFRILKSLKPNPTCVQERIGSSPHTDWGFLTLILQDPSVIGLQMFKVQTLNPQSVSSHSSCKVHQLLAFGCNGDVSKSRIIFSKFWRTRNPQP